MDSVRLEFERDFSLLTKACEARILFAVFSHLMQQVRILFTNFLYLILFMFQVFTYEHLKDPKECLNCHFFKNFACFCWLLRSDVRYVRDCLYCKCVAIYRFKFANARQGELAQTVIDGNTQDHLFICDICLSDSDNAQKCEIVCKKRKSPGRCWPTLHEGTSHKS